MNKKGFTLIELLVVIAILSILSLIAVPAVVKSYNNSIAANMHIQENNVSDAAKLYIEDYCNNRIGGNECPKLYKNEKIVCLSTLQETNYLQKVYYKKIECDGAIKFTLSDTGKYKESKTYLNCGLDHEYQTDPDFDYLKAYDCFRTYMSIKYNIVYYGNGSTSGSTSTSEHEYGMEKELTANGFKRTGSSFLGWSTTSNGSVVYANKQKVKNLSSTNGSKVDLYAQWTTNGYTIAYNANGGDGPATSSTHTYDVAQNLTPNVYTRLGYAFQGWSTTSTGLVEYTDKQSVVNLAEEQGEVVTLYAVWKANTYTIAYNGNGSTSGSMSNSTHKYNESKTLTLNTYIKTGNEFIGWSTTPTGIVEYTDGQEVTNLSNEEGKEVILYAVWKPYTVTITYNANGGSHTGTNTAFTINGSIIYKNASPLITTINHGETISASGLADPDNTGYIYLTRFGYHINDGQEWCTKADGTGTCYSDANNTYVSSNFCNSNTTNCSVTLYANWNVSTYYVRYDGNGATSGSMSNSTHSINVAKTLTLNEYQKSGYEFQGWSTSNTETTPTYSNGQSITNLSTTNGATITLYAVWKINNRNLVFNSNGGTSCASKTVTIGSAYGTLCEPGRTGFMFGGWYSDSSFNTAVTSSTIMASGSGDVTIHAKWRTRDIQDDYPKYYMTGSTWAWDITSGCYGNTNACSVNMCVNVGTLPAGKPFYFIREDYRTSKILFLDVFLKYSDLSTSGAGAKYAEYASRGVTHACKQYDSTPPEYKKYNGVLYVRARIVAFCCNSSCNNNNITTYPSGMSRTPNCW